MALVKIFVGNLASEAGIDDLRYLFDKYGEVAECDVLKNFGFVHMKNQANADTAIAQLDGYNLKGLNMKVELSTSKRGKPSGVRRGFTQREYGPSAINDYPPIPPHPGRLPPPPPFYDRYDPYYRYVYPELDPYYRLAAVDRFYQPERYLPPLPHEQLLPDDHEYLPLSEHRERYLVRSDYPQLPDPRDFLYPRERLYLDDRAAYERVRAVERLHLPPELYYRDRSPPPPPPSLPICDRPPPEYYERKASIVKPPAAVAQSEPGALSTSVYSPATDYEYYRRRMAQDVLPEYLPTSGYASSHSLYGSAYGLKEFERPFGHQYVGSSAAVSSVLNGKDDGNLAKPLQVKLYDSQTALQTRPIYF